MTALFKLRGSIVRMSLGICFSGLTLSVLADTIAFDCRIQYTQRGELSHRSVAVQFEPKTQKIKAVHIDGQPVYTFNFAKSTILTSVDSERVQIELAPDKTIWRSNLRDKLFGNGVCIKLNAFAADWFCLL